MKAEGFILVHKYWNYLLKFECSHNATFTHGILYELIESDRGYLSTGMYSSGGLHKVADLLLICALHAALPLVMSSTEYIAHEKQSVCFSCDIFPG